MEKVLLVGGFGFIGKNIIEILKEKYEIIVISRSIDPNFVIDKQIKYYKYDFSDEEKTKEILRKESPNYIINLASIVTAERNMELFSSMINTNLDILLELYNGARYLESLKLFISFGSAEEYGNIDAPFFEKDRESPNSPYGLSKQLTTNTAIMLNNNYNFPIMVARLGNVFGKYQDINKVIPYFINKLFKNEVIETTFGDQKRDFIYVKDIVYVLDRIMSNYPAFVGEIVNISYGQSFSLKMILEYCKGFIGSTSNILYGKLPYRKNEIMNMECDISKLKEKISVSFQYDIFSGLADYIQLLREDD